MVNMPGPGGNTSCPYPVSGETCPVTILAISNSKAKANSGLKLVLTTQEALDHDTTIQTESRAV